MAAAVSLEDSAGHLFPRTGQHPGGDDSRGQVCTSVGCPGEVALTVLWVLPTAHTGADVLDSNEGLSSLRTLREAGTETETPGLGTVPCL